MNLALNARDAMPDGGKLTLATTRVEIDKASRARNPEAQLGPFISLAVKDTGYGMDAATVGRIFEPFFTTKDPGQGTGMGLATVYGVLKQHGGWIEVDTAPGRGTTIRTFFPLSKEGFVAASAKSESLRTESAPINDITILVVEDEEMLREFVSEALGTLGYHVLSAANGRDALNVWAEHRDEIALLLTDVVMPESISGRQLAHTLIQDKPNLKVILPVAIALSFSNRSSNAKKSMSFSRNLICLIGLRKPLRCICNRKVRRNLRTLTVKLFGNSHVSRARFNEECQESLAG